LRDVENRDADMFMNQLLRRLGNETAVDNARAASAELSRARVEREAVDLFLERLDARRRPAASAGAVAAD
jgi:hypothetical protein